MRGGFAAEVRPSGETGFSEEVRPFAASRRFGRLMGILSGLIIVANGYGAQMGRLTVGRVLEGACYANQK